MPRAWTDSSGYPQKSEAQLSGGLSCSLNSRAALRQSGRRRTYLFVRSCLGSGLHAADHPPVADTEHYPHVAIIGGGIGGVALAVACLHRGIPFTLYERDRDFSARSQGYGLTLQQACKAIEAWVLSRWIKAWSRLAM